MMYRALPGGGGRFAEDEPEKGERREVMKRKRMVLAIVMLVAVGIWCIAAGVSPAQIKTPSDFSFDQGKDSPGKVTFSHQKHIVKVAKCTTCHVKLFKIEKYRSS